MAEKPLRESDVRFLSGAEFVVVVEPSYFTEQVSVFTTKWQDRGKSKSEQLFRRLSKKVNSVKVLNLMQACSPLYRRVFYPSPKAFSIYRRHPRDLTKYFGVSVFHDMLLDEHRHELYNIFRSVGAREMRWKSNTIWNKMYLSPDAVQPLGKSSEDEDKEEETFMFIRDNKSWQDAVDERLKEWSDSLTVEFNYTEKFNVTDDIIDTMLEKMEVPQSRRFEVLGIQHKVPVSRTGKFTPSYGLFEETRDVVDVSFFGREDYKTANIKWLRRHWDSRHVQAFVEIVGLRALVPHFRSLETSGRTLLSLKTSASLKAYLEEGAEEGVIDDDSCQQLVSSINELGDLDFMEVLTRVNEHVEVFYDGGRKPAPDLSLEHLTRPASVVASDTTTHEPSTSTRATTSESGAASPPKPEQFQQHQQQHQQHQQQQHQQQQQQHGAWGSFQNQQHQHHQQQQYTSPSHPSLAISSPQASGYTNNHGYVPPAPTVAPSSAEPPVVIQYTDPSLLVPDPPGGSMVYQPDAPVDIGHNALLQQQQKPVSLPPSQQLETKPDENDEGGFQRLGSLGNTEPLMTDNGHFGNSGGGIESGIDNISRSSSALSDPNIPANGDHAYRNVFDFTDAGPADDGGGGSGKRVEDTWAPNGSINGDSEGREGRKGGGGADGGAVAARLVVDSARAAAREAEFHKKPVNMGPNDCFYKVSMVGIKGVGKKRLMRRLGGTEFTSGDVQKLTAKVRGRAGIGNGAYGDLNDLFGVVGFSKEAGAGLKSLKEARMCAWPRGKADVLLVVYDITDEASFKVLPEILSQVLFSDGCTPWVTVALVGNKSDKDTNTIHSKRKVSVSMAHELCRTQGIEFFAETSAKTSFNVAEVLLALLEKCEAERQTALLEGSFVPAPAPAPAPIPSTTISPPPSHPQMLHPPFKSLPSAQSPLPSARRDRDIAASALSGTYVGDPALGGAVFAQHPPFQAQQQQQQQQQQQHILPPRATYPLEHPQGMAGIARQPSGYGIQRPIVPSMAMFPPSSPGPYGSVQYHPQHHQPPLPPEQQQQQQQYHHHPHPHPHSMPPHHMGMLPPGPAQEGYGHPYGGDLYYGNGGRDSHRDDYDDDRYYRTKSRSRRRRY